MTRFYLKHLNKLTFKCAESNLSEAYTLFMNAEILKEQLKGSLLTPEIFWGLMAKRGSFRRLAEYNRPENSINYGLTWSNCGKYESELRTVHYALEKNEYSENCEVEVKQAERLLDLLKNYEDFKGFTNVEPLQGP